MRTHLPLARCLAALMALAFAASLAPAQEQNASREKEQSLIAVLRSDAPGAEKALACKGLAVHGSEAAVPELAKLLNDEKLASWARIALEVIPGPAADEALRKGAESLEGRLLIGAINSLGVRRDAQAVDVLAERLQDKDPEIASAAAVALGRIGNAQATDLLQQSLAKAPAKVKSAVAEGCILCAEQRLAAGQADEAAKIYDQVREAEVPKQRLLEATRGAILARGTEGIELLLAQLRSPDKALMQIGLSTARELEGQEVSEALAKELETAPADRAALLLLVLADRNDPVVLPAVIAAAKTGSKEARIAAIGVMGRLGDASSVPALLDMATEADAEVAQSARTALAGLQGEKVNAEITSRLAKATDKTLPVLIELVGERRLAATPALVKALDHEDAGVRSAALTALGETVSPEQLPVLIARVVSPKQAADAPVAQKALRAASVRMPDREACAAQLAAALPKASAAAKAQLLETLGAVGGQTALETLVAAVKGKDEELRDTGSRLLGEWMSADAGPELLDLAKNAPTEKYRIRVLRGYIRLARQFTMPDAQRAEMCQNALAAATRDDEQKLVLAVLERYPSLQTLEVAVGALKLPEVKQEATRVALVIAQKVEDKEAAREKLTTAGLPRMKIEIVKAQYGAGSTQKDVTQLLRRQVGEYPVVVLPASSYSASFGGDPLPGTAKQLKVEYRIDGKEATATFPENAPIVLPLPKG